LGGMRLWGRTSFSVCASKLEIEGTII
jgi:hypothetical protein